VRRVTPQRHTLRSNRAVPGFGYGTGVRIAVIAIVTSAVAAGTVLAVSGQASAASIKDALWSPSGARMVMSSPLMPTSGAYSGSRGRPTPSSGSDADAGTIFDHGQSAYTLGAWQPLTAALTQPAAVPSRRSRHHRHWSSPTPTSTPATTTTESATPSAMPTLTQSPIPTPTSIETASPMTVPSGVSSGYPDASTTGAVGSLTKVGPDGVTSGTGWKLDSRGWVEANAGAILENLDIPYSVDVTGDNVTIRNTRITVGGESYGVGIRHARNTLVEDSTITWDGRTRLSIGVKDVYGDASNTTLRRLDISSVSTGVMIQAGLLVDCYIHDLKMEPTDHVNGQTANGSTTQLTIRHNTILNAIPQTDAVSLFQDFDTQANKTIDDNLLAGGGYTIYGGGGSKGPTSNIQITNNKISTRFYPNGGSYGAVAHFRPFDPGNVFSGNVWADGPNAGRTIMASD
jgi:hypothetical protein